MKKLIINKTYQSIEYSSNNYWIINQERVLRYEDYKSFIMHSSYEKYRFILFSLLKWK